MGAISGAVQGGIQNQIMGKSFSEGVLRGAVGGTIGGAIGSLIGYAMDKVTPTNSMASNENSTPDQNAFASSDNNAVMEYLANLPDGYPMPGKSTISGVPPSETGYMNSAGAMSASFGLIGNDIARIASKTISLVDKHLNGGLGVAGAGVATLKSLSKSETRSLAKTISKLNGIKPKRNQKMLKTFVKKAGRTVKKLGCWGQKFGIAAIFVDIVDDGHIKVS
jgi:hypothetical protein